jgi:iron complex outermembrane receptor protein
VPDPLNNGRTLTPDKTRVETMTCDKRWILAPLALLLGASAPLAQLGAPVEASTEASMEAEAEVDTESLKNLSIEELMDLEVTIASRSEDSLTRVPGAVYVLTGDEIRRAGHSSIPEALHMVPGFHVSHWTTGAWDVTARGFGPGLSLTSSAYLNQLVVMIDGVVVYTPLFAGVWWPLQDIDLADVDRVEVIRGPGGGLWGTNATHGVVNIITKKGDATQGGRVSLRNAIDDRHVGVRYGGRFGETGTYRIWTKSAWYDTLSNPYLGLDYDWNINSVGFRADWNLGERQVTFWTRGYEFDNDAIGFDLMTFDPIQVVDEKKGYQIFASVENPEVGSHLQAWFATDQQAQPTFVDFTIDTFDLEYHRELPLSEDNRLTAGAGYRVVASVLVGDDPFYLDFDPHKSRQETFRAFLVDRHRVDDKGSELTLGLSAEHNDFTQFELQPTARFTWVPNESLAWWAAVTRAVRTPSLEERYLSADSYFVGSDDFRSEKLIAYESGVRALLSPAASADLALFYNDYDDLHFREPLMTGQFALTNGAEGRSYGAELAVDAKPTDRWTLRSAASWSRGRYQSKDDGSELSTHTYYPEYQFNLRSYYDLGSDWELDTGVYLVEKLGPRFDQAEYLRVDARLGWQPCSDLRLYAGVQGLTEATHSEFDEFDQVRRAVFVGLEWNPGASEVE